MNDRDLQAPWVGRSPYEACGAEENEDYLCDCEFCDKALYESDMIYEDEGVCLCAECHERYLRSKEYKPMKVEQIMIPQWMRDETPTCAGFCEIVNLALLENPKMTLAEFARELDKGNKEKTLERIELAEAQQFGTTKDGAEKRV